MTVREALARRKSTRAFLDREVEPQKLHRVLDAARHAPSGVNTQPWQVAVVTGDAKKKLQQQLEKAFRNGVPQAMDYQYYPLVWEEPYKSRRIECGLQLYQSVGISRQDKERRLDQWAANYRAFDAPVALFFFLDPWLQTGSYMDYGMFLMALMLAAVEEGLATCPQAALGEYPQIVKEQLGYAGDLVLLGGLAVGYEDPAAPVNSYRTSRLPVEAFTRFYPGG
ncbi:nitroreductase [Desulfofustis limnaeus]|jgi:nitroreductase|uniref:NADH dehydrogenase n=1 Tax=Desulfofustis limnaeus TaxID=2740163 RepID=A0ABM7WDA6_9BACT|nr:nitroreductase [Desulfofustis limnaeus]MDX9894024.1 nitroreductase [Desulfofustis sp.]BDD88969.1 NADH dehydrogenase [Desulfofustis limnaeus]